MVNTVRNVLIDQIQIAFAHVPQPGADNVVVPNRDDEGTEEYFSGKKLVDIPHEQFVRLCTALWFFTNDSLLYYLPGFMEAVLRGADEYGVIWGHVYAQFTDERRSKLAAKLNNAQKLCISEFCRQCGASPEDISRLEHAIGELRDGP